MYQFSSSRSVVELSLDMLSRLKGIETVVSVEKNSIKRGLFCPLDMLSRLKGIETGITSCYLRLSRVRYTLDMLSRLKGIETHVILLESPTILRDESSLDMLSRLKGIETPQTAYPLIHSTSTDFGYAFPFEGN